MSRFKLIAGPDGLALADHYSRQAPLRLAFDAPAFRRRLRQAGRRQELLAKAVKPRPGLKVLDCTGGLGRDAFLLAHLGCAVTLCERSPCIHALLEDALARASQRPQLAATVARIALLRQDSIELLQTRPRHEVIYLDPMFPPRRKDALVKGAMQRLQAFLGEDQDFPKLFTAALRQQASKLILKRPPKAAAASVWQPPPTHTLESRKAQFAIYTLPR